MEVAVKENQVSETSRGSHDRPTEREIRIDRIFGLAEGDAADLHAALIDPERQAREGVRPLDDALSAEASRHDAARPPRRERRLLVRRLVRGRPTALNGQIRVVSVD